LPLKENNTLIFKQRFIMASALKLVLGALKLLQKRVKFKFSIKSLKKIYKGIFYLKKASSMDAF